MANQPTKYRKFVVGAASAALVASAVAPVAFAADFSDTKGNTHEEAINALSEAGVIKGYEDGTFKPNKTLTRSDVVKLMGKWLVSEGYKVPADAQSKPRFADLKSTSNKELLEMAAVVYDNGVFVGTPDGKLDPTGDITRENMAIVIVRAFDRVHDIDLASYVADQDFKKDVTDLGKAKAEARPAIDVLDFFDITNPAAPEFNPKATTTRGHFATFLHKTINADFSDVEGGVVAPGVASVKAVNATTVEVAFKDAVKNLNSLNFTIDGLTVSNAAVKQTDNKVVVLTTAVQKGGEKYTVSLDGKAIGSFEGVSAVIPTKITVNTDSVQGVVGKQVILSADIGTKVAGVPVTFNIKAANNSLNQDNVAEVVTNADGIATYSYTQYNAGYSDDVAVYTTGAPEVRDFATVHWGVDTILNIEANDKKTNELNNGENKVYKVTYKDPKTGKPVQGQKLLVTFAENVDVEINKITHATVNGKTPYQTTNGKLGDVVEIETDSKGEATFTVTGTNTKATPVVFRDGYGSTANADNKLERTELQVKADEVTFGAIHLKYEVEVTRDGGEEAAVGRSNGRVYKVVVKDENGKPAAGEVVNVAFDEVLDKVISTNTKAEFLVSDANAAVIDRDEDLAGKSKYLNNNDKQQITLELNSKGEGEFRVVNQDDKGYATPVVWIDINTASNKDGVLEEGEPKKLASMTYFATEKVAGSALKVFEAGTTTEIKDNRTIAATQGVEFKFNVANQSGKEITAARVNGGKANFQVTNTGTKDVIVFKNLADLDNYLANPTQVNANAGTLVSTRRGETITIDNIVAGRNSESIYVASVGGESASVDVTAYGEFKNDDGKFVNLSESKVAKATFKSATTIVDSFKGIVESFDRDKQQIKFVGKDKIDYKEEAKDGKVSYFIISNGAKIATGVEGFVTALANYNTADVEVNYFKSSDGKIEFTVVQELPITAAAVESVTTNATPGIKTAGETAEITVTFDRAVTVTGVPNLALNVGGTTATYESGSGSNKLVFKYTVGATDDSSGADLQATSLQLNGGTIVNTKGGANAVLTANFPATFTNVKVDAVAPVTATEDGTADKDATTQAADFDIIVNAETGAKVTATIGGVNALKTVTDITAAAGKATLPIDITKLATGSNAIEIVVTDAAGNASAPLTVNVTK